MCFFFFFFFCKSIREQKCLSRLVIKMSLAAVTKVAERWSFGLVCTVHKVLSCPPRSHEGKVSLPTQQRGWLPFLFCSRIQQPGAFSTGRLAKRAEALLSADRHSFIFNFSL